MKLLTILIIVMSTIISTAAASSFTPTEYAVTDTDIKVYVNETPFNQPILVYEGNLYAPLKPAVNALGGTISYNDDVRSAYITTDGVDQMALFFLTLFTFLSILTALIFLVLVLRIIYNPYLLYKRLKSKIAGVMLDCEDLYLDPISAATSKTEDDIIREVRNLLVKTSRDILAFAYQLPFYGVLKALRIVPREDAMQKAAAAFCVLAENLTYSDSRSKEEITAINRNSHNRIRELLRLDKL